MAAERDYVLGTHEEELARLGLQHRVWRPVALDCWQRAGITVGKRVLDVGAGPGYAAIDLAEIVGPSGEVVALERSQNFICAMESTCRARSLANVKVHELDLMKGELPKGGYDFAWCRWVVSFVNDQSLLIEKLGRYAKRQHRYFSRVWSLRDVAILSSAANTRTFPPTRCCDMARIWRRTGRCASITRTAWGEWFCDSLRKAAHLLPPPERLHVAMACHIHRDLSRTPD